MVDDATTATTGSPKLGRLDTFVPPTPSPRLIRALAPVNRVLCLAGTPGLRDLPVLGRMPGFSGLTEIVRIDLPAADEERFKRAVNRARPPSSRPTIQSSSPTGCSTRSCARASRR